MAGWENESTEIFLDCFLLICGHQNLGPKKVLLLATS